MLEQVRKMTRVASYCLVVSLVLATMIGCGMGKGKFVGRYVSEQNQSVLEIKRDGTFEYETKGFFSDVTTGEWRVVKEEGLEIIAFTPFLSPWGPSSLEKLKKSNNLVNSVTGQTFVKGMRGGHKELIPGSEQLERRPGESIPGAAMNKARGVECGSNLRQIRLALQMAMQGEEGQPPGSLGELSAQGVTPEILSCPVSGQPYSYDPSQGKVWCATPGHEQF